MNKKYLLIITFLLFSFVFLNCGKDTTKKETDTDKTKATDTAKMTTQNKVNADEIVAKISKYRVENEKKLVDNAFKRKVVDLKPTSASEDTKQKWEKFDAYYDNDKLIRLQVYPHKGISERTEEFYLMDGKLVFAFIQDKGPKIEGKDSGEPGKEFYFDNGKLIKYVNKTGREEANLDEAKKMYESKLPIEFNELIEILKGVK
jgi:hypothetical protein